VEVSTQRLQRRYFISEAIIGALSANFRTVDCGTTSLVG
jgi:hypothetical protein